MLILHRNVLEANIYKFTKQNTIIYYVIDHKYLNNLVDM